MKVSEARYISRVLSGLKLNKITDREIKNILVSDYLVLRRISKKTDEDLLEVKTKFQKDWIDEIPSVRELRESGLDIIGHDGYLEAERDANLKISEILSEEADVKIESVPVESFVSAFIDDDITLEEVALLEEYGLLK